VTAALTDHVVTAKEETMAAKKKATKKQARKPREVEPEIVHGPEVAVYALRSHGSYDPTLVCLCGEEMSGDTWEDAGAYFDDHLSEHGAQ
jgi:hypothetical protein